MPERLARFAATTDPGPAAWRRLYALVALAYPFFHLIAPSESRDPWWIWWTVSGAILAILALSRVWPWLERNIAYACYVCSSLTTLHIAALAAMNPDEPFFVVGAAVSMAITCTAIRTRGALRAYVAFGFLLLVSIAPFYPDPWDVLLCIPVPALGYTMRSRRMSAEEAVLEMSRQQEAALESALDARTRELLDRTEELTEANRRLRREMEHKARLEEELRFSHKIEAVGRLAGGVAHDFNNRLTTIGVYAELLLEGLAPDSLLRPEVTEIQRAERQAADLTRQLLAFSRRGEVRADALDLDAVIEGMTALLRHLLGEDVRLVCLHGQAAHWIRADREEIEQVLLNLALNARDAMPGGGQLTIETSVATREQLLAQGLPDSLGEEAYVVLDVSDSGIGMDPETAARAFDPFFTRKPVGSGTGLGLSTVFGVVTRSRGHVRVLTEAGKGARFELLWPLVEEGPAKPEKLPEATVPRGGDETILLVEDDADLRRALNRMLSDQGYGVIEAAEGSAALRMAATHEDAIDLVVSDVVMPQLGGIELAEKLAARSPRTPVLLISGQLTHPALRERAIPKGVALLPKPFTPRELLTRVREILDG